MDLHELIRKFYLLPKDIPLEDKIEYLKSYTTVTFVRHPFIRLVSSYKDKIINMHNHPWRKLFNVSDSNPFGVSKMDQSAFLVRIPLKTSV